MTTEEQQPVQTPGVVSDYFSVEGHLLSTRTGDAYKAVDRQRQQAVCLWMQRSPFAPGSEQIRMFLVRMQLIDAIEPAITPMTGYGVDAEGTGFAMLPALDGHSAGSGNIELSEAERRFIAIARVIDKLHNQGIVCGDLSPSNFWVDRTGEIVYIGVLGSVGPGDMSSVPNDLQAYVAPEERKGGMPTFQGDVYSLGVICHNLLTRQEVAPGAPLDPVSRYVNVPPVWSQEIIDKATSNDPSTRFESAGQLLQEIVHIRQRSFDQEQIPVEQRAANPSMFKRREEQEGAGAVSVGPKMDIHREDFSDEMAAHEKAGMPNMDTGMPEEGEGAFSGNKKWLLLLIPLITAVVLIVAVEKFITGGAGHVIVDADGDITDLGGEVSSQYSRQVQKLQDSNDPLAHSALIDMVKQASSYAARIRVEEAILERTRRLGFTRSSEQLKQWLSTVRSKENPAGYEPLLRVVDPGTGVEERSKLLRQAYPAAPPVVLRLAAALALDEDKLPEYQSVLAPLVGDNLGIDYAASLSTVGLMLAHEDLSIIFADDIVQNRAQLKNEEISKVLAFLARRNDVNTRAVANIGLERGILSPLKSIFLETIRDRKDLEPSVLSALTKAASGSLAKEDLQTFGRWYDGTSARVLLAIAAEGHDKEFQVEAFDLIAGKSPTMQPAATLLDWVRNNRWDERGAFAQAIGTFAFLDLMDTASVKEAFDVFDQHVKNSDLIFLLLDTNHPVVVSTVMEKYADIIDLGTKLNLLKHPMKDVRMAAVKSIETNDVGALKIIVDNFEAEKDPEVKKAYQKFWMIRERTGNL